MADRYWVGGTGTWNSSSTANWSAMSGGTNGASAPTSSDNVFFNASSGTGTVTITFNVPCASLNTTGVSASLLFSPDTINVYGSLTLGSTTTLSAAIGFTINMRSTTTGNTVSCTTATPIINGLTFGESNGTITTGGWSFSSSITARNISLYTGALNTNGQTVTVGDRFGDFASSGYTRSLTLGASTINCGTVAVSTSGSAVQLGRFYSAYRTNVGMTFNAGTSTINIGSVTNNTGGSFVGVNGSTITSELFTSTFNTVNINCLFGEIHGTNTFANLTVTATEFNASTSYVYPVNFLLYANQTVTGALTLQGSNASNQRLMVLSNSWGTSRTITTTSATASVKTLKWVNFQDITLTNSGSALGPLTLVGDCAGNTFPASTFDTPITCYAKVSTSPTLWSSAMWFTTSGGSTAARVPLPQDSVIFDANTGNHTVQVDMPYLCASLNTTGYTSSITQLSGLWNPIIYGTLTNPSDQYDCNTIYAGRSNISIGADNSVYSKYNTYVMPGATVTLSANFVSSSILSIFTGTFTTNNYDVTIGGFETNAASISGFNNQGWSISVFPTINLGSSFFTADGTGYGTLNFRTSVVVNAGTSTIRLNSINTGNGWTKLKASGQTFYRLRLNATRVTTDGYTNQLWLDGTMDFNSIDSTGTAPCSLWLTPSVSYTFTSFNLIGTASAPILVVAGYTGSLNTSSQALTTANLTIGTGSVTNYVAFWGIVKSGASALSALGVANISRNSGITFPSTLAGLVYRGIVGSNATGSFVVPANYQGSNLCIVYGGGGGAGKAVGLGSGGAGSGRLSMFSNLNNISAGQTIYYQAGAGGMGATVAGNSGGNGGDSWLNTTTNANPTTLNQGIFAAGASGAPPSGSSAGGTTGRSQVLIGSAAGTGQQTNSESGGGGGAAATLLTMFAFSTQTPSTNPQAGGGGGGGARTTGATTPAATGSGGNGGSNINSLVATGGLAGAAGDAGTAGGGGGGGGFSITINVGGGAGGASGYGAEYIVTQIDGVDVLSTNFGGSGGGGGGGRGNGTGIGGAGGSPSIAGGGAGGGGGATSGNGGDGGVGAIIFLYTIPATLPSRSYGLIVG
jgi:hypothetical protein